MEDVEAERVHTSITGALDGGGAERSRRERDAVEMEVR